MLSDAEIAASLAIGGVSLEFTRDSPLFRQQLSAYEQSQVQWCNYVNGIQNAWLEVERAITTLYDAQSKFANSLTGSSGGYSRCLFTNSFPKLGTLSDTLRIVSETMLAHNAMMVTWKEGVRAEILPILEDLSKEDFSTERQLKKEMEFGFHEYESLLESALLNRTKKTEQQSAKIIKSRSDYEMRRFEIVSRINQLDCKKKLMLTKAMCSLHGLYSGFSNTMNSALDKIQPIFLSLKESSIEADKVMNTNSILWEGLGKRLQGELIGAMAPPGSPPGALSPVQPRFHTGMPAYTATLTTEVLSPGTRSATYEDTRHARDDGIFKQGYLFVQSGIFFGRRRRKWYRLYATKLYTVEVIANSAECNMEIVCDVFQSSIIAKPGDMPHKFIITSSTNQKIELQAENEDEMVKWITAIRRCANGAAGRPNSIRLKTEDEITVLDDTNSALVLEFIKKNPHCAECSAQPVSWISTSLGLTLCEECAVVHRQLTWAVSKLKSIKLDQFSSWQMNLMIQDLGNDVSNDIWEKCVPEGWTKPQPHSAIEDKSQWIMAKYRWFGFVDEFRVRSNEQLAAGIMDAVLACDIKAIMWWLSHKADINCSYPEGSGRTPLHAAIESKNMNVSVFLLQNGADIYAIDSKNRTPVDEAGNDEVINRIITNIQNGDY